MADYSTVPPPASGAPGGGGGGGGGVNDAFKDALQRARQVRNGAAACGQRRPRGSGACRRPPTRPRSPSAARGPLPSLPAMRTGARGCRKRARAGAGPGRPPLQARVSLVASPHEQRGEGGFASAFPAWCWGRAKRRLEALPALVAGPGMASSGRFAPCTLGRFPPCHRAGRGGTSGAEQAGALLACVLNLLWMWGGGKQRDPGVGGRLA